MPDKITLPAIAELNAPTGVGSCDVLGRIFEFDFFNNIEITIAYICRRHAAIYPCSVWTNRLRVDLQYKSPTICQTESETPAKSIPGSWPVHFKAVLM